MAVHRTIVVVDVEGFGDPNRTNRNQVAVRDGLYKVLRDAFYHAGIPWSDDDHEDRGDGVFILVPADVPKGLFAESLPAALVMALRVHNDTHPREERIRLRMALHAGEVNYDQHGATSTSVNLAFRLLEAGELKAALAGSAGVLAVITSSWFYEEVVRHSTAATAYLPVRVTIKETSAVGWICPPDRIAPASEPRPEREPDAAAVLLASPVMALHAAYAAAMAKPITLADAALGGLRIPTLGDGYIDHRIRVAQAGVSAEPARESWWDNVPVNEDAHGFFTRYLISPDALKGPLILLGQPGSGKSVLTRVLAARLPPADFLPVRVELRQVPAEDELQDQIEFAVRHTIGERLSWPQLVASGHGALPVVMFDGFDELLQATGVMQTDFLFRVQAFQEREAIQGRPLAAIVTSRTAVADRARIPQGTLAVRLEPFSEAQVTAWRVWERFNRISFEQRGIHPLPARIALSHENSRNSRSCFSCSPCMTPKPISCSEERPDSARRSCTEGC